ncbi:MAG TPA: hypothetical protein PKD09_17995 [Aggregatilinea sp.]|uniref:hypothetical protein n=1 Tax=Aggregatilinea sp. TaxID=2806333 RepID=UPI002C32B620|nr:hypothetical protein [Aggregatilinea sp.]HML23554.1 hypothetical protein [Aggregatilinea sp.]
MTTNDVTQETSSLQRLINDASLLADLEAEVTEALSNTRNLLAMSEPGWIPLGQGSDWLLAQIDRTGTNRQARWYYHNDPIAEQGVRLHNSYTFGRGVAFKAKDARIQAWLDAFWGDMRNRQSISRAKAQWRLNTDRQLDGELFFALYVSTLTGRVTVRTIDPNEISDVITADDPALPVAFKRTYTPRRFDVESGKYVQEQEKTEYLPDWRNADPDPAFKASWSENTEIYVMHVLTNPLGGRGISHLATGLPWLKATKGFMEDRATLTLALATFAFKQKVKGNRAALQRVMQQWGTFEMAERYGIGGEGTERRKGAATFVENESSTLEQLKTDSGSGNAYTDMRMFRQYAGLGVGGIFEHYLGDPSTGNLATATAMELPMLKMFEFEQQFWEDVYGDLFWFAILQGVRYGVLEALAIVEDPDAAGGSPIWALVPAEGVDLGVEVTLPPIVQSDVAVQAAALASIATAEVTSGTLMIPAEQKMLRALTVMGYDNAGEIVATVKASGGFALTPPPTADAQAAGQAFAEGLIARLREAASEPPKVGKPLDGKEAEKVEPIKKSEVDQAFDDFAKLPELDKLLKQLGVTLDDVDEALREVQVDA